MSLDDAVCLQGGGGGDRDVRPQDDGVEDRDTGYRIFFVFTAFLWIGCIVLGIVMGFVTGSGTGFGDTHLVDVTNTPMSSGSLWGESWRIAVSFAALAALPAAWYWFLQRLGDFGFGGRTTRVATERDQAQTLLDDADRHPVAAAIAYRTALFSVGFLLLFGNFFLPYVVLRWGWGGA